MRIAKFAAVLSLLAASATASAATLYVSTSGNDANPGTLASPFRTITKASSAARAGDVVEVRGGVYGENVKIGAKGSATARIVFRSYPGETAIIDGATTALDSNLVTLAGAAYVDFSGFEVRNAKRIGICGYPANHVRITNNRIHRSERNGIYFGSTSSDVTIEGNAIYNNVLHNQYHTLTSGGWGQAVAISNTPRTTIRANKVHENDGEGIVVLLSDDAVVEKNEVRDNFSVGIYLDNAQTSKIDANFVYSSGNTRYFRGGYPASGIGTANENYSTANPLDRLTITNNIVVNTKYGFYYSNEEAGGGLKNSIVANNTFHNASRAMLWIAAATHTGTTIQNNIFSQVTGTMTDVGGTGVTYGANVWYGGSAGAAAGTGDVLADPRFVNATGTRADDFRLTTGSPAVERAVDLTSTVGGDYFGTSRTGTPDIGAHELSTGTATDTIAPSAPRNLTVSSLSSTSIGIRWDASTDDTGVTAYRVYRRGVLVASVGSTSWTDTNVAEATSYSYQVFAIDAAGNVSPGSDPISVSPDESTKKKKGKSRAARK